MSLGNWKPLWNEDAADGQDDPRTSERTLMDWILTPGNYSKYRRENNNGAKKSQFALQVAGLINKGKTKVERTAKDVINKIQHLEKSFKLAWEYVKKVTGTGVKENDPASFEQKIESKYLLPIMGN